MMKLSTLVNVDVKMSKKMLHALTLHETHCMCKGIEYVDENQVKEFLIKRFNQNIADEFKPEFLYIAKSSE